MSLYSCKCGKTDSVWPQPCETCPECNTSLSILEERSAPWPHSYNKEGICIWCNKKKDGELLNLLKDSPTKATINELSNILNDRFQRVLPGIKIKSIETKALILDISLTGDITELLKQLTDK